MTTKTFQKGKVVKIKKNSFHKLLPDGTICVVWGISSCGKSYTLITKCEVTGGVQLVNARKEQVVNAGNVKPHPMLLNNLAKADAIINALVS